MPSASFTTGRVVGVAQGSSSGKRRGGGHRGLCYVVRFEDPYRPDVEVQLLSRGRAMCVQRGGDVTELQWRHFKP